ncbi:hypothetical protein [Shewanella gaetbuli]
MDRAKMIAMHTSSGLTANPNRAFLMVIADSEVIMTLDNGGAIVIPAGGHLAPKMAMTNAISFSGDGTIIVNTNGA